MADFAKVTEVAIDLGSPTPTVTVTVSWDVTVTVATVHKLVSELLMCKCLSPRDGITDAASVGASLLETGEGSRVRVLTSVRCNVECPRRLPVVIGLAVPFSVPKGPVAMPVGNGPLAGFRPDLKGPECLG